MFGKAKTVLNILKATVYESIHMRGNAYDKLVREALLLCHALEKGMGIKNVKKGYGKDKALQLLDDVHKLLSINEKMYISQECIAVLNAYVDYQQKEGNDVSEIKCELDNIKLRSDYYDSGCKIVSNLNMANFNYGDFSASRHSLRQTSDEKITETEFLKAIQIASSAPSACNRQPWKVYYSFQEETNRKLAALVPGNKSFADDIKYYCVLAAKRSLFGGGEYCQWYINGGIFLAYFVQALHSLNIGSCIFQWPIECKQSNALRRLIGNMDKDEATIAVIGFGKYPKQFKAIAAQRKPAEEIAIKF